MSEDKLCGALYHCKVKYCISARVKSNLLLEIERCELQERNHRMEKFKGLYRIPSARLKNWNYSSDGVYSITICTRFRINYFGEVMEDIMRLSEIGKIADDAWKQIPEHFHFIRLGEFAVMPDHMHGIIIIDKNSPAKMPDKKSSTEVGQVAHVETLHATSLQRTSSPGKTKNKKMARISPKPNSISTILRSFKSAVTNSARKITKDFGWQARFHDRIVRNFEEYNRISNYIKNNPANWNKRRSNDQEHG